MKKQRAFLKWAGGKYSIVNDIRHCLPKKRKLIEPFVGAGTVFLNTDYDEYLLSDINPDLINLYQILQQNPEQYIEESKRWFNDKNNEERQYFGIRAEFNQSRDPFFRSIVFLYLNRFGFNGLCRYNQKMEFNVPFGRYEKPYFPEKEIIFFAEKSKRKVTFRCESYQKTFSRARRGCVIYCDPPYVPLSVTSNFTAYAGNAFTLADQADLAKRSLHAAHMRHIPVLISNHDTALIREMYKHSKLTELNVKRTISSQGENRQPVSELLAYFESEIHD